MAQINKTKIFCIVTGILIILYLVFFSFFSLVNIDGDSMYPTLKDNNKVVIKKTKEINRFDIVVFNSPRYDSLYSSKNPMKLIKRVVAVPNDTVEIDEGFLIVNGKIYKETYVNTEIDDTDYKNIYGDFDMSEITPKKKIPKGMYLVLGDNRTNSTDSRDFGLISSENILGKAETTLHWNISKNKKLYDFQPTILK